jgi:hypothetical protein
MDDESIYQVISLLFITAFVAWVFAHYSFLFMTHWRGTTLVREMLHRGYSAQEVIRICQMLGQKKPRRLKAIDDLRPAKPIKQSA